MARTARKGAMPWLAGYARLGHVAKGMVYVMAGADGAGALTAMYTTVRITLDRSAPSRAGGV
jgi:hypothetical protein